MDHIYHSKRKIRNNKLKKEKLVIRGIKSLDLWDKDVMKRS
jgi:hypothetical protein